MTQKKSRKPAVEVSMNEEAIVVSLNIPVRFSIPRTKPNIKFIIVFLRLLFAGDGSRLCTFSDIAMMFGYADRRNVNNYWREFEQQGSDILGFLSRKVDFVECIPLIEDFVAKNMILPIAEMHRKFVETYAIKMSMPTFQKYLSQTCSVKLLIQAQKLLINKLSGSGAVEILRLLADQHNVPVLCDGILEKTKTKKESPKPDAAMKSTLNRRNLCLLVHYLIASLNISQICQERLAWNHLDLLFSKNTRKAA